MIRKKIYEIRSYVFAEKENFQLEHRLFLSSIVVGILVSIFGGVTNYIFAPSPVAVIIPFSLTVLLFAIYYFVRFRKIVTPFVTPIIIVALFGISTIWIFNGGINGSNIMIAFAILILGLVVVPEKSMKYIILIFLVLNVFILLIQFYRPDLITEFPTETDRWIDHLMTLSYSSVFIYLIIRFVHKNYTLERLKVERSEIRLFQLNADKDRFISILGHDLKNPIGNLLGLSELLREDIRKMDIDEIESFANKIHITAQNTNILLEDILKWAGAKQGNIPFEPQILYFRDICIDIIRILSPIATAKYIAINYSASDNITVYADIDMLKTVLRNLLSNAIKFTNIGGTIIINAYKDTGNVTISVSDNGIGIAPESVKKLFNISEVLTTRGTTGETGTGLGLLLCKEFVEKHNGKIWVESETGKGSDFKFSMPVYSKIQIQ